MYEWIVHYFNSIHSHCVLSSRTLQFSGIIDKATHNINSIRLYVDKNIQQLIAQSNFCQERVFVQIKMLNKKGVFVPFWRKHKNMKMLKTRVEIAQTSIL